MFKKQIRPVLMLILVVAIVIPFFTTTVSAAYENTYYNTGNMRDDIIGVALTQVGYTEGYNNYTKYGEWYGYPNLPWCGMFVSWCAKEAGIPTSILNRTGIADPDCFGLDYMDGYYYTPQKGDLFFKKDFSHVGLVYYTDGSYFYTVEGNTSDVGWEGTSVLIQRRRISDCYFSSPNYTGSGYTDYGCDHDYVTRVESDHPHYEYEICTKCDDSYYTGYEIDDDDCITCIQASCDHSFGNWTEDGDNSHSRICSECDLEESESHDWENGKVLKEATCVDEGSLQIICTVCNKESTESIDATNEHTYGSFSYINETNHQKVCRTCGEQSVAQHTLNNTWKSDSIYHWTSCADCNGRICHEEHNFPNGCMEPCEDCGYVNANGHRSTGEKLNDDKQHWEICSRCNQQTNVSIHMYSSACDEICNGCGYKRTGTTEHKDSYFSDEKGHWEKCASCSRVTEAVSHTADINAQDWENRTCIHCEYVLRSSDAHIHIIESVESDAHNHWGTCSCGEEIQPEVHIWNFQTNTCSVCGVQNAPVKESSGNLLLEFFRSLFNL